jgi:uncharacterized protein YbdZ (MbtH family)
MYRGPSKQFKVVRSREDEYGVWHAEAAAVRAWKDVGQVGTADACWDYIAAQRVTADRGYLFSLAAVAA